MGTYVDLEDIKDLLLTKWRLVSGGRRIDFSEAYENLRVGANNTGSVVLARVDMDDTFAGSVIFTLQFTSSTQFDAFFRTDEKQPLIPCGSGDINTIFSADNSLTNQSDSLYSIQPSYWSGTPATGDTINWRTSSTISNEVGELFIADAEAIIDSGLLRSHRVSLSDRTQLYYSVNAPVPLVITTATKYIAAFLIYQAINPSVILAQSEAFQWWIQGKALLDNHIESIPTAGPQWVSRAPLLPMSSDDKLGTPTLGLDYDWKQPYSITLEDALSRLRNYELNKSYLNYKSQSSNFP